MLALVVGIGVTALAAHLVYQPKLDTAVERANKADRQATKLTSEIDRLEEDLSIAEEGASRGVADPWLAVGRFTTGDDELDREVKDFCDNHCSTDQEVEDAARDVYTAIAMSKYVERDAAQNPMGSDWRREYAHMYYENGCSGNCYEFASFLMYCLRYMGYKDAMAQAVEIEFQGGFWGDHGIVFVTDTDGRSRLCDTAHGADGWMLKDTVYNYRVQDRENW